MFRRSSVVLLAGLAVPLCGVAASAETMRCQSVNGNLNCAGSGGVSCQTVDGRTVCVGGHGDVVQSFGNRASPDVEGGAGPDGDSPGRDDLAPGPVVKQRLEQRDQRGHTMLLERDGTRLHLRTDWLSLDRE